METKILEILKNNPCHLSIKFYFHRYSSRGQRYCQYLYSARYRPKPRKKNSTQRVMIPDRTSATERPAEADDRLESGHYEFDSVVSSKHSKSKYALAVVQERASRLVRARLVLNLKPSKNADVIIELTKDLKVESLTSQIHTALGRKVV